MAYEKNKRGKGFQRIGRDEVMRTIAFPPKHEAALNRLMDKRGLNNVSDFIRQLIIEERDRQDARALIFTALDAAKGSLTPALITRILNALNRD